MAYPARKSSPQRMQMPLLVAWPDYRVDMLKHRCQCRQLDASYSSLNPSSASRRVAAYYVYLKPRHAAVPVTYASAQLWEKDAPKSVALRITCRHQSIALAGLQHATSRRASTLFGGGRALPFMDNSLHFARRQTLVTATRCAVVIRRHGPLGRRPAKPSGVPLRVRAL